MSSPCIYIVPPHGVLTTCTRCEGYKETGRMPTERSSSSEKELSPGNGVVAEKGIKAKIVARFKRKPDEMGKKV